MITQFVGEGKARAGRVSLVLATAVVASLIAGPAFAEEPIDCPDYRVYGAAGTNAVNHELADDDEELLGKTTVQTAREIRRLLANENGSLKERTKAFHPVDRGPGRS